MVFAIWGFSISSNCVLKVSFPGKNQWKYGQFKNFTDHPGDSIKICQKRLSSFLQEIQEMLP